MSAFHSMTFKPSLQRFTLYCKYLFARYARSPVSIEILACNTIMDTGGISGNHNFFTDSCML